MTSLWARPGIEPGTFGTRSENHYPRSTSHYIYDRSISLIRTFLLFRVWCAAGLDVRDRLAVGGPQPEHQLRPQLARRHAGARHLLPHLRSQGPLQSRQGALPRFYLVLPSFTEFYLVLPSFTEFYRVLPSVT